MPRPTEQRQNAANASTAPINHTGTGNMKRGNPDAIVLYSAPQSMYAGRARSYFIKAGLPFEEHTTAQDHYVQDVVPKAGGRGSWPAVELPEGTVIRDGVAIVDHFEAVRGHPARPPGPRQHIVSLLFDVIGAEGLLRPGMHYRWNFDEVQGDFIRFHFTTAYGGDTARADAAIHNIKTRVNPEWGLRDETVPVVERLYEGFLDKFNAHLAQHPHLLGGIPCVGDFGLAAPLYGHLGRDPVPLRMMQTAAPWVFRWVERMNKPEPDTSEYQPCEHAFLANDEIPDTLRDLLAHVAIDFVPETVASRGAINEWLATHDVAPGSQCRRYAGATAFEVLGTEIRVKAQPFRFYLLQRVHDAIAELSSAGQEDVRSLLDSCGMGAILGASLDRRIGRANNLEVWL